VIDIPAVPDCADAINNLSGLIEFKRYLGQAVEIAAWMRAQHERNLWFGKPDFRCRFHRTNETDQGRLLDFILLGRFAPHAGVITLRQTFVRRSHGSENCCRLGSGEAETGDARGRDGGVRELAAGVVQLKPTTEVEAAP
jgi:hypothetical protein